MPYSNTKNKLMQLKKTEQQLTFAIKGLSAAICTILLGSCVSQPTIKPNQGKTKTVTVSQTPATLTPVPVQATNPPVNNSYTIVNTGQMRPQTPQYQSNPPVVVQPVPQYQPPVHHQTTVPAPAQPTYVTPSIPSSTGQINSFSDWQLDFLRRAGSAGQIVHNAHFVQTAINQDKNQAEFITAVWEYLDRRTTAGMVSQGQQKRRASIDLFERNEVRYGVPASIVTAIWGIETGYGANMGKMDLVDSLSTLAYEGRRRSWAEGELIAMGQLVANGDVTPSQLKGSYAGGMGHTQFIPTTWQKQGVDGDGDGRKSPFSMADAVTSTANYLANAGWVRELPAYFEVSLPQGFDYRHIGQKYTLDQWRAMGLNSFSDNLVGNATAELWLPAGINGPILLLTKNFDVIKVYNNSSNYALAVAVLAQKLNGRAGLERGFPRNEQMLSKNQAIHLQNRLNSMGYNVGTADGIIGTNTRRAFAQWQASNGQIPDGFISQRTASQLLY